MRLGSYRVAANWPHAMFLGVIMLFAVWYYLDARSSSASRENLILVEPAAFALFVLALVALGSVVKISRISGEQASIVATPGVGLAERLSLLRKAPERPMYLTMALFAAYIPALFWIGFDVATFLFIGATQFVLGERRPLVMLAVAGGVAALLAFIFKIGLRLSMPMLLV